MNKFTADDEVLVSPRHLAGGGPNQFRNVLGPLIHMFDWPYTHNPSTGHITIDSPCGSTFIDFTPTRLDGIWWNISHYEPYWKAQFSRQTPAEALSAITQTLPQLIGDDRHARRIPLATNTLPQTADLNSWTTSAEGTATVFTSADGHCAFTHEPDSEVPWRFEHSVYDGFDTHWNATFTQDTPKQLVAEFFTNLASSEPAERVFGDVPYLVRHHSGALITPVQGAAVNPHVHHAVAQVAQACADRTPRR
ncbi:DUF317 domain-containing protein [Streptomyces decoyicus]|uniref:DUF317 domain-containing protein n=1 Tax=Streptomyces decoyicus TaxID=249567 RepID=UPI00386869AE